MVCAPTLACVVYIFLYAELMQILGVPNEKNRALPPKYNIPYFSRFLIPGSIVAFERLK